MEAYLYAHRAIVIGVLLGVPAAAVIIPTAIAFIRNPKWRRPWARPESRNGERWRFVIIPRRTVAGRRKGMCWLEDVRGY